ncbi:MAG: chitobiase/beta-hexosaminidase C-terminal domain-containing protein [bacterium]
MRMKVMTMLGLVCVAATATSAAVNGRYVRFEAPASSRMGIHELEVWSQNANIALKNKALKFAGIGWQGGDINERNRGWAVIDGVANFEARSTEYSTAGAMNVWLEMDFGAERTLDKVVVKSTLKPIYDDRAKRLVTVLDGERRVLWSAVYDIRKAPFDKGTAAFELAAGKGPLIGRTVPAGAGSWAPLADVLEVAPAPTTPGQEARAVRFAQRNSPAAIEQLAKAFFACMDLDKPELAGVRAKFQAGAYAAALDAYRDHFLKKLQTVAMMDEGGHPLEFEALRDLGGAADLLRGVAVTFERFEVSAQAFSPGMIDWENTGRSVGEIQQPLLFAFVKTGDLRYLAAWSAITDDWGMNLVGTLDRAAADGRVLRNYFVKDTLQNFNGFAASLAYAAGQRAKEAGQLSGATLARLLIPVLEDYLPPYWWVCRRAVFNHTFNAMNAATVTARILDDFHAGERLDRENRQHWQRVGSMMMTRDGSMQEIGDEGHLFMQWRMAAFVDHMKRTPPPWLTPDFLAEFETIWRQTVLYPLRHLAPDGYGHRLGHRDYNYFNRLWWLLDPRAGVLELGSSDTLDNTAIVRAPEFAAILQAVFGAGHERTSLQPDRQEYWDKVTGFYGRAYTPPRTVSDWMPYAGLWYLRRDWAPDATYVHMLCQPKGHPGSNGSAWNTELHYFDYGSPLLALGPVWIDGQPPFNEAGTQTYKPGSKTECLTTASERPIPSRWHTSPMMDYAESFYEGTYQTHREARGTTFAPAAPALGESPVAEARADRRVILFRPARLLIVTDAVHTSARDTPRHYEIRQRFATPNQVGKETPPVGTFKGDARRLTLVNDNVPGVTVHRFTSAELSWDPRKTPDSWTGKETGGQGGAAMMDHTGVQEKRGGILRAKSNGLLLMSALLEPHRIPGETIVMATKDLSSENVTGFAATLADGATLIWLATDGGRRKLQAGSWELEGEALLLYQRGEVLSGLILGGQALRIDGRRVTLESPDCEVTGIAKSGLFGTGPSLKATPIHRPIDPVTFSPQVAVFTGSTAVTLASATPGVQIRYTLDGREPDLGSPLYTGPVTLADSTYIRARAFRPGCREMPFTSAGTEATVVSEARYVRRALKPAVVQASDLKPGLCWERVAGSWRQLFSHLNLPDVLPAVARGQTERLLDVSMRQGDGPFGVRYSGFLDIPADGVWTFHAPEEYVGASCEPGYDLRVWVDGEEWDIGQRYHGRGLWSVPLAKGPHRLLVTFADARHRDRTVHTSGLWAGYPSPWVVWKGESPVLEISGPGTHKKTIPQEWLRQK